MRDDDLDKKHWEEVEEATELLQEGNPRDALYLLRDLARESPHNPYVYHYMGVGLFEVGQLEAARDAYRAAVRLAPAFLGARTSLAQVLRLLKDHRGAIDQAREALKLAPRDADALHAMGLALAALGNRAEARKYLQAFLASKPELEASIEVRQVLEMLGDGEGPLEVDL